MIADLEPLILRLCSALGNGVAQGLLLAGCALIGLRVFRNTSAATRYAVAFATLLTVAVLPAVHFILSSSALAPTDLAPTSPSRESATERLAVTDEPEPKAALNGPVGSGYHSTEGEVDQASSSPTHASIEEPTQPADESAFMNFPPSRLADDLAMESLTTTAESGVPVDVSRWSDAIPTAAVPIRFPLPTRVAAGIVAAWLILACLRLASLAWQCVALQRLKRQRQSVPDSVQAQFAEIRTQMGLRRTVDIGTAPDLRSPIAIGFLRPAILLPEALIESAATDLDPMLRHELAHIQRRDDWTNLAQQLVKAVYFFHPGILALCRRLNLDREIACDDHVLSASRAPRDYALFLTDFASRSRGRQWAAAPAAWNNPSQLQERIRMILDSKRNTSPRIAPIRTGILSLAALLIAATGIGAAPRLALDASQPSTETTSIPASAEGAEIAQVEVKEIADVKTLLADTDHVRVEVFTTDSDDDLDRPKEKPERGTSSDSKNENRNSKFIVRSTGGATTVMPLERHHTVIHATPAPHPAPAPHPEMAEFPQPPKPPRIERSIRTSVMTTADSDEARSLEERMRRLEKLVESLVQKRTNPERVDPQFQFHFEGLAKSMEQASKDVERSMRDAERKVREAQQRTADITREKLRASAAEGAEKGRESRRRALEQQRDSLQRQIDKLQSNVDMLESHLDRLEDELDNAEEESDEGAGKSEKAKAKDNKYKEKEKEKTKPKHPDGKPDQAPDSPAVTDPNTPPGPPAPGALIRN